MPEVIIYSTPTCTHCNAAKMLLRSRGMTYTEINLAEEVNATVKENLFESLDAQGKRRTVPQIFIDGVHIGGNSDLRAHFGLPPLP